MEQESVTDLLLLPFLLTFFGALVYGLSVDGGLKRATMPASRWIGVGLVALGLFAGFHDTWMMIDVFNRGAVAGEGKKALFGHYLAGLVPLVALVVCLVVDRVSLRRAARLRGGAVSPAPAPPAG